MIIKGKRGPQQPDDESRSEPARETSALIKHKTGAMLPPPAAPPRRTTMFKRGTYSNEERAPAPPSPEPTEAEAAAADEARSAVVHIPTGESSGASSTQSGPPQAHTNDVTINVPQGPAIDQQIIEEAKKRGEAIVRQAQMDAKKVLEEAKIYAQNSMQQAERDGYEQGKQRGYQDAQQEMASLVFEGRSIRTQSLQGREALLRSAQPEIAQLAMKIAERVTATAVVANPEVIQNQVAEALQRVKDREHISVRVNPGDLEVARANKETFERMLEGPKTFDIVGDNKVDRGGCIIETNLGNVDARIATQLQALKLAFAEVERRERQEWEEAQALLAREASMAEAAMAEAAARQAASQSVPAEAPAEAPQEAPPLEEAGEVVPAAEGGEAPHA